MESKATYRILFAMALLYFVSVYISDSLPGGQLLTVFSIAVMLIVALRQNRFKVRLYARGYFLYIIVFIIFCALSRLWAEDPSLAITKINSLLFVLLAMIAIVTDYAAVYF